MNYQTIPVEKLEAALADIRDMLPTPEQGSHLERAWQAAMTSAEGVVEYVQLSLAVVELAVYNLRAENSSLTNEKNRLEELLKALQEIKE
jgi:hypothetical protein